MKDKTKSKKRKKSLVGWTGDTWALCKVLSKGWVKIEHTDISTHKRDWFICTKVRITIEEV